MGQVNILQPNNSIDPVSLIDELEVLRDGFLVKTQTGLGIKRRFGYKKFCNLGTSSAVNGLYWSDRQGCIVANSNGKTFKISDVNASFVDLTGDTLLTNARCTYVEMFDGADLLILIANGDRIVSSDFSSNTAYIADADAPTKVSHIAGLDQRVIANIVGTNTFQISDVNAPLSWDGAMSYDAEKNVDNIDALYVAEGKIYIIGRDSIETWYNAGDATDPLVRQLSGNFVEDGCFSPDSISLTDSLITMFDKKRRVVTISGDSATIKSGKMSRYITELASFSTASATNIKMFGKELFLLRIPGIKTTLCYDYIMDAWSVWGYWNEETTSYEDFKCNCYAYARTWNKHLIGGDDGWVYEITEDSLDDDGNTIRFNGKTGHMNGGDDSILKESNGLYARLKIGAGTNYQEEDETIGSNLLIRKNDNGSERWSNWKSVSLGFAGETGFIRKLYEKPSTYFTRQLEFVCSDSVDLLISSMFENLKART